MAAIKTGTRSRKPARKTAAGSAPRILAVDVGGTHVKALLSGQKEPRRFDSGPKLTARQMAAGLKKLIHGWKFDAVSIGYPGVVWHGRPAVEPHNLGSGWVGFDYEAAFGKPVRILNDAAMQAIGSYEGGRMLFLGLGTGLGTTLIIDGMVEAMELGHMPYRGGRTYEDYAGEAGLKRLGKRKWRKVVADIVDCLVKAFEVDYVVLGGGNARLLKQLPPHTRHGDNANAFTGGFRIWTDPRWKTLGLASSRRTGKSRQRRG